MVPYSLVGGMNNGCVAFGIGDRVPFSFTIFHCIVYPNPNSVVGNSGSGTSFKQYGIVGFPDVP